MITREEAWQRADTWLNGGKPDDARREIGIYEFVDGYVVWPVEPEPEDPTALPTNVGGGCGIIDKETGELSYGPSLSADLVAERYSARRRAQRDG